MIDNRQADRAAIEVIVARVTEALRLAAAAGADQVVLEIRDAECILLMAEAAA